MCVCVCVCVCVVGCRVLNTIYRLPYLPTPPVGQDMTHCKFLSGV